MKKSEVVEFDEKTIKELKSAISKTSKIIIKLASELNQEHSDFMRKWNKKRDKISRGIRKTDGEYI
ncbi:MAG: hypothetical protein AB1546_12980 [bacterium]